MRDACLLREIPIGQVDMREDRFGAAIDAPPNHAHLRCIPKTSALALYRVFLVRSMHQIMARLTEGDQIIRAVPTRFSRLDMMHSEDRVFRLAKTPLAAVIVTKQHVLAHIPEP